MDQGELRKSREENNVESPENDINNTASESINEKALVRKIDIRLVPVLSVLYLMAHLDRINISNALTLGLPQELQLKGAEVNVALTIFFIPYILFEIPANMLLKRLRPHIWLSGCMAAFGLVTLAQGFVQGYSGLLATRFFLGVVEAGVFPGCFYILSMWYKREEAQKRFTFFFGSSVIAGAFGGLLASGIQGLNGAKGYSGWRWIFIIQGAITAFIGLAMYFLLLDFPEDTTVLDEDERAFMKSRLDPSNDGAEDNTVESSDYKALVIFFKDPKNYLCGCMYLGLTIPAYGLAYFTPTIVRGYGYGLVSTQLHSIPPFVAAWGLSLVLAYFSDRLCIRSPFIAFTLALAIIGTTILLRVHNNISLQYGSLFMVAMGTYSCMPLCICWYTMNLEGSQQRAIGTGWQIGFGNIGAIAGTFSFVASDGPYYVRGYSLLLGGLGLVFIVSSIYFLLILRELKTGDGATRTNKYYY